MRSHLPPVIFVSKVFFETGDVGVAETFRVRAGNETVPASERVNTTITVNTDCGAVDGVSTRLVSRIMCHVSCVTCHVTHVTRHTMSSSLPRSACCGLESVRYVTIQAEGDSAALKTGKLLVKVALPRCDDSTVASDVCISPASC